MCLRKWSSCPAKANKFFAAFGRVKFINWFQIQLPQKHTYTMIWNGHFGHAKSNFMKCWVLGAFWGAFSCYWFQIRIQRPQNIRYAHIKMNSFHIRFLSSYTIAIGPFVWRCFLNKICTWGIHEQWQLGIAMLLLRDHRWKKNDSIGNCSISFHMTLRYLSESTKYLSQVQAMF